MVLITKDASEKLTKILRQKKIARELLYYDLALMIGTDSSKISDAVNRPERANILVLVRVARELGVRLFTDPSGEIFDVESHP